ncbi:MAG: hypothetical protein V2J25_10095 [Desulfatiglans sp.]|jgi:hypothetical protein|nr:hypothetical protein [Desulfatiglans sp.]
MNSMETLLFQRPLVKTGPLDSLRDQLRPLDRVVSGSGLDETLREAGDAFFTMISEESLRMLLEVLNAKGKRSKH